jgi:hypothetical protein
MARTIGQYVATDSSGRQRVLWGQELNGSCGPASCYMTCCSVRQSTLGGGEAFMRHLAVRHGASLLSMIEGTGVYADKLKSVLIDEGLTVDLNQYAEAEFVPLILSASERRPIIFHISWYRRDNRSSWVGNGGHFVVCVGAVGSAAVILDPWFGLNEIPFAALPAYNPSRPNQSLDPATSQNWGQISGWMVRVLQS